jgi:hypothetical protein
VYNEFFFTAAREARAKIIAAEGEQKASRSLKVNFYIFDNEDCQKMIFRKQLM